MPGGLALVYRARHWPRQARPHDLPGGAGTLEEIFEVWTWVQIGLHDKPCVLLNLEGFYDALLLQLDHMEKEGLLRPEVRRKLLVAKTPAEAVALATS